MRKARALNRIDRLTGHSGQTDKQREFSDLANRLAAETGPEKETAAQAGPLNGGGYQNKFAPRKYVAAAHIASVRLAPIWADGYLAGWIPLSYAAAQVLSRIVEGAR